LALAVPLSRFTSQVGGGSAFYVRQHCTRAKMKIIKQAFIYAIVYELILVCLYFAFGHIQGSSYDHTNLIGGLVFYLHFPGIYLMASLHYLLDGYTAVRWLTAVISVAVVQWFVLCLCFLLISKRLSHNDAA
jgi:hypothetical protein